MDDTLKVIQTTSGFSDTVLLAIVAALLAVATLIIKGIIEAQAKKAEVVAALEAAKVSKKLEEVELKIDGRLTELLRITKAEAEERGQRLGKDQEQARQAETSTHSQPLTSTDPMKLKITEGEIKVIPETKKKK